MISSIALRRIVVVGDGLAAAVASAYLGVRCRSAATEVIAISAGDTYSDDEFVARPSTFRFNSDIGVDASELCQQGIASPLFGVNVMCEQTSAFLPFSPGGVVRGGVDFHQYWLRASQSDQVGTLEDYSFPFVLDRAKEVLTFASASSLQIDFGLKLKRGAYSQFLVNRAIGVGVTRPADEFTGVTMLEESDWPLRFALGEATLNADFVVDVTSTGVAANALASTQPGWTGNCLRIANASCVPGAEFLQLQRALTRFVNLIPARGKGTSDMFEFNRVFHAEEERIADMECLLNGSVAELIERPALARKIDVFSACGRIPIEDYEIFQPCEWLAALLARGYSPKRAERLAERLPAEELYGWLQSLRARVDGLRAQVGSA